MVIEYDSKKPKAIVEYKNENAGPILSDDPNIACLTNLANMAGLPFFGCRYATDFKWFVVAPLNDKARQVLPEKKQMSERDYVSILYKIRGRDLPPEIAEKLNGSN